MGTNIVTVNVFQVQAPTPPTLQQTGAFVSQGGTNLSPGTFSLLTELADLTPLINGSEPISTVAWSGGVVTVTAASPHGFTVGSSIFLTIAGTSPTGYNGTFLCTITSTTQFTYALASNPGTMSLAGVYTNEDVTELLAKATTFFAQGSQVAVYVLEFGAGSPADGVAALSAYLVANPNVTYTAGAEGYFYVYLVPRTWADEPTYLALIAQYENTTGRTYFFTTCNLNNRSNFTDLMKDVLGLVEAPKTAIYPANALTALTYTGDITAASATVAAPQSGSGSYAPGDVLTVTGNTGTEPTFNVTDTEVVSVVINAVGSGGTPGLTTFTGTTGTGTKFQFTATIAGDGTLTGATPTLTVAGDYTVNPSSLTSEPITGGSLTGATVTIKMGVKTVTLATAGAISAVGANPLSTTVSPNVGTGCTLNVVWNYVPVAGFITATTTTDHGVPVGATFQLSGVVPAGYDGYYVALDGTVGDTLIAAKKDNPGVATTLGILVASTTQADGVPSTEFSLAAAFWKALGYAPSSTNKLTPFAFSFLSGVTPWPRRGVSAILSTLKEEANNYVWTAAEGGITNTALFWGMTKDSRDFTYWYSVDWAAINSQENLANAVINGSNNPVNPLYYNQEGINRLQDVVVSTMRSAVTNGLATGLITSTRLSGPDFDLALDSGKYAGQIVVNAVPFIEYLTANPGDYKIGRYAGLSVQYIPTRPFIAIVFNLYVTDFLAA